MKSVMQHQFSKVPKAEIQRSVFDRSHGHKTAFDAGYLVPILIDEVLPGDSFTVDMAAIARLATPVYPLMDNLFLDTHFFAVPIRQIWNNWERFNGAQDDPADSTDYEIPQMVSKAGGYDVGSLHDYMGLPTAGQLSGADTFTHSALFLRAYNWVWNNWFRDENLQDSVVVDKDDGPDLYSDYTLLRRGKRHDYFTSCLPWPQKGDAVEIPIGTSAPVMTSSTEQISGAQAAMRFRRASDGSYPTADSLLGTSSTNHQYLQTSAGFSAAGDSLYPSNLYADLSSSVAATVNELRQAFQIQRLLERDARGGTRYIEIIKAHFNVDSPDARLQRPEYLGGGSSPILVTPVPQTSSTDVTTPQGNLSAYGVGHVRNHGFTKSFTEHCIIIGVASVRADLTYQQGLNRMWSRLTRYDFYWPALAHLGEQAVLTKEIYCKGQAGIDNDIFGYQERYAEYRYKPSMITGILRSTAASGIDQWHLSQEFSAQPLLDTTFIQENPPLDRVIAVPSQPHIIFDSYFRMRCARPMPVFGVPGFLDHF